MDKLSWSTLNNIGINSGLRDFAFKDKFGEIDIVYAKDSKDAWRVLSADLGAPQFVVKKFFKRVR